MGASFCCLMLRLRCYLPLQTCPLNTDTSCDSPPSDSLRFAAIIGVSIGTGSRTLRMNAAGIGVA